MSDLEWGLVFGVLIAAGLILGIGLMFWWMFVG